MQTLCKAGALGHTKPEQQSLCNNINFNSEKSLESWNSHTRFQAILILPPVMQDLETIKYDFPDFTAATALCQETSVQKRQARGKKPNP